MVEPTDHMVEAVDRALTAAAGTGTGEARAAAWQKPRLHLSCRWLATSYPIPKEPPVSAETASTSPITQGEAAEVGQAIEVLTALARRTRVRGEGTPDATTVPVDFADLAAQVLTAVAANVGSAETLLAGRSGSWEADLVRRLVNGTAGYEADDLLIYRTEPIRLPFHAGDLFDDFGITDLYDHDHTEASEAADANGLTEEQMQAADDLLNTIDELLEQDQAAYAAAYKATAQRYLTERGATCAVEIDATVSDPYRWDGLAEILGDYALQHTPLPMTGNPPDSTDGSPADALRRAGLTYTARAQAQLRGMERP